MTVTKFPNPTRLPALIQQVDVTKLDPDERDAIYNHFKGMDVVQSIAYLHIHCGREYAQSVLDEAQAMLNGTLK